MITTLKFSLKLIDTHSTVRGLWIDVTEAIMTEVTGLPKIGMRWFGLKATNLITVHNFLVAGETVQLRGMRKALESLPRPWDQVVVFLN